MRNISIIDILTQLYEKRHYNRISISLDFRVFVEETPPNVFVFTYRDAVTTFYQGAASTNCLLVHLKFKCHEK